MGSSDDRHLEIQRIDSTDHVLCQNHLMDRKLAKIIYEGTGKFKRWIGEGTGCANGRRAQSTEMKATSACPATSEQLSFAATIQSGDKNT